MRLWPIIFSVAVGALVLTLLLSMVTGIGSPQDLANQATARFYDRLGWSLSRLEQPSDTALAEAAQAIQVISETERRVNRDAAIRAVRGNPLRLIMPARGNLRWEAGRLRGVMVTELDTSPWTEKVGLQVGDVILTVNGKSVTDASKMSEIYRELVSAPTLEVGVERHGQPVMLRYVVD